MGILPLSESLLHVGNQMVSGTTLQTNMAATRTVIVEDCKVEIPLDITAQQLSKKNCRMTGICEASKKLFFLLIARLKCFMWTI